MPISTHGPAVRMPPRGRDPGAASRRDDGAGRLAPDGQLFANRAGRAQGTHGHRAESRMNPWVLGGAALAVLIGAVLPLQALVNARLGQETSGALFASFVSFLVGTIVLAVALVAARVRWPTMSVMSDMPGWIWMGGLIGAIYVLSATVLVPRIGAASLICLIVLGQLVGSLLMDHYGVLSDVRPIDAMRVVGAVLVAVGAVLVVRPWAAA
ncbi:DMT family transporter [Luteimonas yindakuii]|uniref:DMT family transporter n=2 Tax=Luteimonas yindakuii TaxID=2565782 RepID=A0A4Z1RHL9_9GAMM|nr:DMT family transporter [Luteimonas yindakuii]